MTELFILAGGEGSRFFPFTALIPKCLIPVAGKPCIRWIIEDAIEQSVFNSIVVCINKKDELEYTHELRDLDVTLSVSEKPLGTLGELANAMPIIGDPFVVRYGDDLTEVNYNMLLNIHKAQKAALTLAVTTKYELPVGVLETLYNQYDVSSVKSFLEKPRLDKPIWTGVACMSYESVRPYFKNYDIARDLIPQLLESKEKVVAYNVESEWFDVGNIEHWRRADEYYRRTKLCD
jgi:NDP-sugar pyrophosphorylase family protein